MITFNLKLSQIGLNGTFRIKDRNRMTNRVIEHGRRKSDYVLFLDEQFGLLITTMDPNRHSRVDIFMGYNTTFDEDDNIELLSNDNMTFWVKCYRSLYSDQLLINEFIGEDMSISQLKKISIELYDHFIKNVNSKVFLEWIAYNNYKHDLMEIGAKYDN